MSYESLPLAGLRVLDLSRALSGPFCSMILGDLGADVIKVEPAPNGDMVRQWGPFAQDGTSVYYLSGNRNKRCIAINFRHPDGLALLRELAGQVDVLVENFRAGIMAEMGLSPESLRQANPKLVIGSITGFGNDGPKGAWPGFDQVAQGFSGFMSFTGTPESGPQRVGVAIGDLTSGMWTAIGILGAIIRRNATGSGQHVSTSLMASLVGLLSVQGQRYLSLGQVPKPVGNVHPVIAPYGVFEARDGPLNIACATQDQWVKLARLLGLDGLLEDGRFIDNAARMDNSLALKEQIEARLRTRSRSGWTEALVAAGIPAGPINDLAAVFEDSQVQHCGLVESVEHPTVGTMRQVGNPLRMDGMREGSIRLPPPVFGEHTVEILAGLGYGRDRIDRLLADGVVFEGPRKETV